MELFGKYENNEEFLKKVSEFLEIFKNKEIIVWGAGKATKTFFDVAKELNIKYIIDSNKNIHGQTLEGFKIMPPEVVKNEDKSNTLIVIMPYCYDKYYMAKELETMGYDETGYCFGYDYILAYSYFKKNKIVLPALDIFITSFCTLKCKNCIAHLPYYKKNKFHHMPFESIKKDIDGVFSFVDYINLLSFSTGEVILHPDFIKIIEYIAANYREKYRVIHFVTNGTVIPDENLLKAFSKYDCYVYISNYTHTIKDRSKIKDLTNAFASHSISYSVFNDFQAGRFETPSWNDLGDISISHGKSEQAKINMYHGCANHTCIVAHEEKIYACGSACWGDYGGVYDASGEGLDYIKYPSNDDEKLNLVRYFLRATQTGYPAICDRCEGVGPLVNKNTVPAGEQLIELASK